MSQSGSENSFLTNLILALPPVAWRLSGYILRRFFFYLLMVLSIFAVLVFFGNLTELLRRAASSAASFWVVAGMALLQTPSVLELILPLTVLIASLFCFLSLARSREAIVARTSGLSHVMLTIPVILASLGVGVLSTSMVNPAISVLAARFEQLEARYIKNQISTAALLEGGVWLRTAEEDGTVSVMHAPLVDRQGRNLRHAILLLYDDNDKLLRRIDADSAWLEENLWTLTQARIAIGGEGSQHYEVLDFPTALTPARVQESLASPETISFWGLWRFIELAEAAGFSAIPHWVHFYKLLLLPFALAASALLGSAIAVLYIPRISRAATVVAVGGLAGFGFYIFASFFETLGLGGDIPPLAAMASPTLIAASAGMTLIMFGEK